MAIYKKKKLKSPYVVQYGLVKYINVKVFSISANIIKQRTNLNDLSIQYMYCVISSDHY